MIDWVTAVVKFQHEKPIGGNITTQVDWNDNLKWQSQSARPLKGSYEDQVSIKSEHNDGYCSHIFIHGNLVKFFQGHNIFGTEDLKALLSEFLLNLPNHIDIGRHESPVAHIMDAEIHRIDITNNFRLESREQVNTWIASTEQSATLKYRGRGLMTSGTLYYGKHSKRWALKFYSKGKELDDNKRKHRAVNEALKDYSDSLLRAELVMRRQELKKQDLTTVRKFEELENFGISDLFEKYIEGLEIGEQAMNIVDYQSELTGTQQAAYQMWLQGFDLREVYPKSTFYDHRRNIFNKIGVNVAVPRTDAKASVSYPTIEFIRAEFESIPEWAVGTDLYFEPRAGLKAVA